MFPSVGKDDDLAEALPSDATKWQRFSKSPVTKRSVRVLVALAIGVALLAIINVTMVPRSVPCASLDDCRKVRRINTMVVGVRSLLNLIIAFVLVFVVLHEAGVDTKALLATAGIVGLVVGLGAQPAIKSFIAGITYISTDQFSIGDFVAVDLEGSETVRGIVRDFSTQTTTLQNLAGGNIYIPNSNIKFIANYSQNHQRVQVDLHVSHKGDIDVVLHEIQALNAIMATARVLKGKVSRPPVLKGVTQNGKSSYTVTVSAITEPMSQLFVERYMRYQLLRLMQRIGIEASSRTLTHDATTAYAKVKPEAGCGTGTCTGTATATVLDSDATPAGFLGPAGFAVPGARSPQLPPAAYAPAGPASRHYLPYSNVNVIGASLYRPETERGDMSVTDVSTTARTVAETLRHDADIVYDGHLKRRAIAGSSKQYGSDMGIDDANMDAVT
jgi:small conductance mechanosensitive channel